MTTYGRQPVTFVKGEGVWLWDEQGNKYLDGLAGVAVNGLGHAHPGLVKAISEQAARMIHVSNIYHIAEQEQLADRLCALSGMDRVSSAPAAKRTAAIKHAAVRPHKGIDNPSIVVMDKSFTAAMATLSQPATQRCRSGSATGTGLRACALR